MQLVSVKIIYTFSPNYSGYIKKRQNLRANNNKLNALLQSPRTVKTRQTHIFILSSACFHFLHISTRNFKNIEKVKNLLSWSLCRIMDYISWILKHFNLMSRSMLIVKKICYNLQHQTFIRVLSLSEQLGYRAALLHQLPRGNQSD